MSDAPVVVKVGGSLLDWDLLPARLGHFIQCRQASRLVLLTGGGGGADWIRRLDEIHGLGEESAHILAIQAMELSARVLAAIVPGLQVLESTGGLEPVWNSGRTPVFSASGFLAREAAGLEAIESSWRVTSDTIAARLARRLDAAELVLLKSISAEPGQDLESLAHCGLVDPAFPGEASLVPSVTYLNLRDPAASPQVVWKRAP